MQISIEGVHSVRTDSIVAPCCDVCFCTIDRADQRLYVQYGGAPKGTWPAAHYDCAEYERYAAKVPASQ